MPRAKAMRLVMVTPVEQVKVSAMLPIAEVLMAMAVNTVVVKVVVNYMVEEDLEKVEAVEENAQEDLEKVEAVEEKAEEDLEKVEAVEEKAKEDLEKVEAVEEEVKKVGALKEIHQ